MEIEPTGKWLLICPAEDPSSAEEFFGPEPFRAVRRVAEQFALRRTWDPKAAKHYIGWPRTTSSPPPTPGGVAGVTYPAGTYAERHPANNDPRYAPARPETAPPLVTVRSLQVSKDFRLSEFACSDPSYNGLRCSPKLVELLQKIRDAAGGPIRITSGYRPPAHNRAVGGAASSLHLDGTAADIYADHLSTDQLRQVCERVMGRTGGLGYYPRQQFVHVDVGEYSRWTG